MARARRVFFAHCKNPEARCKTWNARFAGKPALTGLDTSGHKQGGVLGHMHKAHRVIWAIVHGEWPRQQIDHINGDPADNRLSNLRDVSNAENCKNQRTRSTNTSGHMGISWRSTCSKWGATIRVNGKTKSLGVYERLEDAVSARKRADREYGYHENHGR